MKQCPRCLNEDPSLFGIRNNEFYCRACISLMGKLSDDYDSGVELDSSVEMEFELTAAQQELSDQLLKVGLVGDTLVEAVCGAGKTELVLELIRLALSSGKRVGWMVARRQVVLQLGERLSKYFSGLKVVCVTGGFTSDLSGDLIIMTAHQLYRYPHTFDLMIIDEPDAFPFKGNKLLEGLLEVSVKGTKIYLSATPDQSLVNRVVYHLKLDSRPHRRPLVIPRVIKTLPFMGLFWLVVYSKRLRPLLVFVPSKELAKKLKFILGLEYITSESIDKDEKIKQLSLGLIDGLITTTLLERGVTFVGINVIVYQAHHPIFDEASLIQISGRVDRSFKDLGGECLFICDSLSPSLNNCIKRLNQHNQNAFGV